MKISTEYEVAPNFPESKNDYYEHEVQRWGFRIYVYLITENEHEKIDLLDMPNWILADVAKHRKFRLEHWWESGEVKVGQIVDGEAGYWVETLELAENGQAAILKGFERLRAMVGTQITKGSTNRSA